jgi:hypothetical protein
LTRAVGHEDVVAAHIGHATERYKRLMPSAIMRAAARLATAFDEAR